MAVKVNTNAVRYASNRIAMSNRMIQEAFSDVETAIHLLSQNWRGKAGEDAVQALQGIKSRYASERYREVKRLEFFLENNVACQYDIAERRRSAAAEEFK